MRQALAAVYRPALVAVAASLATLARAQTYAIDSNISDWGINTSTLVSSNAKSQMFEDNVGTGAYTVGPYAGGQEYDAEAIYLSWDSSRVYVGVLTGMSPVLNHTYNAGDILFDFNYSTIDAHLGSTSTPDFALVLQNSSTTSPSRPTLVIGSFYQGSSWATDMVQGKYVVAVTAGTPVATLGSGSNNVALSYSNTGITGLGVGTTDTHYFIEASIPVSAFGSLWDANGPTQPVEVRWAMYCGNDLISTAVVPEPSTVVGVSFMLGGVLVMRRSRLRRVVKEQRAD